MIDSSKEQAQTSQQTRLLVLLLRLCGLIDCLAFLVVLMPDTWIAAFHSRLGIGPFPHDTITYYLARSSSLMYAIHGLLLIFVSFDLKRYMPLFKFLALIALLHGLFLIGIDYSTGMPWWWTAVEGPLLIAWGTVVLLLTSRSS